MKIKVLVVTFLLADAVAKLLHFRYRLLTTLGKLLLYSCKFSLTIVSKVLLFLNK